MTQDLNERIEQKRNEIKSKSKPIVLGKKSLAKNSSRHINEMTNETRERKERLGN